MTDDEFNEKYKDFLEPGHYGCAIGDEACIAFLDKVFEVATAAEGFSYSQLKWKFNMARIYWKHSPINTSFVEDTLNTIYDL